VWPGITGVSLYSLSLAMAAWLGVKARGALEVALSRDF